MSRAVWSPVSANTPERKLIGRAQGGDVGAFEALASVHADRLYTVALRILGDGGEAEDVLQETLLRAWRGIRRFEGRAMVFTWLYRIAVNESNRVLERRQRLRANVPVGEQAIEVPAPLRDGPASQAERRELREALRIAIGQLS